MEQNEKPSLPDIIYLTQGDKIFQLNLVTGQYVYIDCGDSSKNRSASVNLYHDYETDYYSGARLRYNESTGLGKTTAVQVYGYGHPDGPLAKVHFKHEDESDTYFKQGPPWSAVECQ